jgi:hypothetical protein
VLELSCCARDRKSAIDPRPCALEPNLAALDPSIRIAPNCHFKPNFNGILAFDLKHKKKKKKNKTKSNK